MTLTIGSLFSGYGGLDQAVETVTGAQPAWFCEYDEGPSKILNHHWPHVPNLRDVTQVDWSQVEPVDIITGGSPCQDLSQAGKRAGMTEGTRSNLWVNMREAIHHLKPQLVVWENVLGALSATAASDSDMEPRTGLLGNPTGGHLRALGRVCGDMAEIGYDTRWTTLRASDVGAPHHRARVFLIAWPSVANAHDKRRPDGLAGGHGAEVAAVAGRGQALSHAERHHGGAGAVEGSGREARLGAPTASGPQHGGGAGNVRGGNAGGEALSNPLSEGRNERRGAAPSEAQGRGPHGEPDGRSTGVHWGEYAPAVRRWERIIGPAPAPTEPNSRGNPRLNAAFAEWMMGLPAGHVTAPEIGLTRVQQLKALGNGVVPQQAEAALRSLLSTPGMLGAA